MRFRSIKNIFQILVVTLISVTALAQTPPPFKPDDSKYPELLVQWDGNCHNSWCCSSSPGMPECKDNGSQLLDCNGGTNYPPPNSMTGNFARNTFCNSTMDYNADGWLAGRDWPSQQALCRDYFDMVKESMIHPCQYIVAYGVKVKGGGTGTRKRNYAQYHIKDDYTPPMILPPFTPPNDKTTDPTNGGTVMCSGDGDLAAIQFRIEWEPDCKDYEYDNAGNPTCPPCYENRKGKPNSPIKSQGCLPATSGQSWGTVGPGGGTNKTGGASGGPNLGLGDFYNFGSSGSIDMFIPTCLFDVTLPDTPFNNFDADRSDTTPKVREQFDRIDNTYGGTYSDKEGGKASERTNQYRGECGRGKYFYKKDVLINGVATKFRDSNMVSSYPPEATDDATTSEIWESRTGCYNPEERFVHLPPYADFKREPAAIDRIKKWEFAGEGRQDSTGSTRDGPPDEPEAGSGDSEYFIPDDRLLMEHPLCTMKVYGNTMGDAIKNLGGDLGDLLSNEGLDDDSNTTSNYGTAYVTPNLTILGTPTYLTPAVIQDMTATKEDKSDMEAGALPMCLTDDYGDDVDNYCLDLLAFLDNSDGIAEFLDEMGLTSILPGNLQGEADDVIELALDFERQRKGKYNVERYYFNYDTFCWEQKERPLILPPDPYERWMPLAIRSFYDPADSGSRSADSDVKKNFADEDVNSWSTDFRRPTFTPYAERQVYDYTEFGEDPGRLEDNAFINLSLEEYGYGDIPHNRLDYAFDPTNIYKVDPKPTPQDLLLDENKGRKYKLQQCLRMYLEQWAYVGDKGSILVSSKQAGINIGNKSGLQSDVSMCQWVAYYDTSQNYTKQRDDFKTIMQYFLTRAGLADANLAPKTTKAIALSELIENDNKAKRGLRPEYFDYMNFLTASVLPVEVEDNNLTNKTELDGGEHYYDDLYNRLHPLDPKKPEMGCNQISDNAEKLECMEKNIPTPGQNPQKINFAKRDCETVVPPQFWRDTIIPFWDDSDSDHDWTDDAGTQHAGAGCHEIYGFRNISDLLWTLDKRNGTAGSLIGSVMGVIEGALQTKKADIRHWMTTQEDTPVLSLVSAVPSLPVFAFGIAPKPNGSTEKDFPQPYTVENWEKFDNSDPEGNKSELFEIRDVWMSRAGGETAIGYHLAQRPDKGKWKLTFPGARLGLVVLDEEDPTHGREWIDHSFPARDCMHMQPLNLGGMEKFWDNPNNTDPENIIQDAWKNWDDIRLDYLSMYLNTTPPPPPLLPPPPPFENSNTVKDFGGFFVNQGEERYYKWLPTVWSTGFGIGKNFWCEFEVPYFPYFIEDTEFNHAKKPVSGHYKINGQNTIAAPSPAIQSFPLEKKYKPRLEYYRVERIRDGCGPFGIASTWVDDPNNYISDWLVGKEYTYKNTTYGTNLKLKSRCADWYDSYKRKTNDPKIIAWRLPRFDYEFLKSFLECTGPIKTPDEVPPVCKINDVAKKKNEDACNCEIGKGVINALLMVLAAPPLELYKGKAIECYTDKNEATEQFKNCDLDPPPCNCSSNNSGLTGDSKKKCDDYCGNLCVQMRNTGGLSKLGSLGDCFGKYQDFCEDNFISIGNQLTQGNMIRALDYCTRGDTDYAQDWEDYEPGTDPADKKLRLGSLKGFDNGIGVGGKWNYGAESIHSVDINKFWLKNTNTLNPVTQLSADDPYGFWCKCPADNQVTTRCREDFCTCQQHALTVGRDFSSNLFTSIPGFSGGGFISQLTSKPVTVCKWYGPYLRWLQCFYQARAKACPVVTREISDTPPYDSVYNPFRGDKQNNIPNLPEVTQRSIVFNTCTIDDPDGTNLNNTPFQILDYLRWSKEEPNHLARLPVWFESAGAGYKSKDLVFQTQTRRWESPFMELAVPFPIDLITRNCVSLDADGNCIIDEDDNNDGEYKNNLLEIKQRGGLGTKEIKYTFMNNPNEYSVKRFTALLNKEDNSIIRPTGRTLQNANYMKVYERYIAGLYAAHLGFRHQVKPKEPWNPTDMQFVTNPPAPISSLQNIHPRAQEAIVGPRGCDIGGWYEMMLYQARCIRWWKLNCICDYDKTFAIGNDTNYVLKRAGTTFKLAAPSLYGAKYKIDIASENGSSYAILPSVERNPEGQSSKPGEVKAITRLQRDADGNIIIADESEEILDINTDEEIVMPLADRGVASPEYAKLNRETDTDYVVTGLDNVQVGDIVLWGEYINFELSSGEKIDAGYPRHVAYVERVNRVPGTDFVESFEVSEMNWGKGQDSCGNTNRWGRVTRRTIKKPLCASNADANDCPYGKVEKEPMSLTEKPGTINTYASCQNADWAVCVEKYWDQVMIYRPLLLTHTTQTVDGKDIHTINGESDPQYYLDNNNNPICLDHNEYPKPLTEPRFQKIMNMETDADGNHFGVRPDLVQALLDTSDIEKLKNDSGKFEPVLVRTRINNAYKAGDITYEQFKDGLWKLMLTDDDYARGYYAIDEVEAALFDASNVGGAFGRCDPPGELRDNIKEIEKDYRIKHNLSYHDPI